MIFLKYEDFREEIVEVKYWLITLFQTFHSMKICWKEILEDKVVSNVIALFQ